MAISSETKVLGGILAVTVVIIVGGAFIFGGKNPTALEPITEPERLVRADDATWGPADAPVTVVEFGDFQCPSCAAFFPALKAVKTDPANQDVRFVYRHFPLSIHEFADAAAQAAVEAQRQNKFWEYHDTLFSNQANLDRASLEKYAADVGLNVDEFKKALDDKTHQEAVRQDMSDGNAVGIQGTPTIFINNQLYREAYSPAALQAAINEAKAAVGAISPSPTPSAPPTDVPFAPPAQS